MKEITIRLMEPTDIKKLELGFKQQGWHRDLALFERYFKEQSDDQRFVVVAEVAGELAGYATLMRKALHGPFAKLNLPEINDFNVFEAFQRNGIGNLILEKCEDIASTFSKTITIGVGMHPGYGPAQRLYVKRGYIPDGSGLWFEDKVLPMNAICKNNDSLALYLSKEII